MAEHVERHAIELGKDAERLAFPVVSAIAAIEIAVGRDADTCAGLRDEAAVRLKQKRTTERPARGISSAGRGACRRREDHRSTIRQRDGTDISVVRPVVYAIA